VFCECLLCNAGWESGDGKRIVLGECRLFCRKLMVGSYWYPVGIPF
jgi:hypothetical protein